MPKTKLNHENTNQKSRKNINPITMKVTFHNVDTCTCQYCMVRQVQLDSEKSNRVQQDELFKVAAKLLLRKPDRIHNKQHIHLLEIARESLIDAE